jgi:acetyl-CoA acetyltransferase
MREAVIVSTTRTSIGRAFKGSLNHTKSPSMLGHVIAQAVQRAGIAKVGFITDPGGPGVSAAASIPRLSEWGLILLASLLGLLGRRPMR